MRQGGRSVIQDFCPLAESLEWELGQEYLRERGNKAFISDANPVPFVVNNDGTLSRNAAEVFFASLQAASRDGPVEGEIFVLELGIGVGLFARYFLDAFRELVLAARHGLLRPPLLHCRGPLRTNAPRRLPARRPGRPSWAAIACGLWMPCSRGRPCLRMLCFVPKVRQ